MKNLKGKKVLVYGLGGSGSAASKLLHSLGACVSVYDEDKKFRSLFCFDEEPLSHKFDLVVVSPGIKVIGNSLISGFRARKTPVISEIDLGSRYCRGKLIAVTGTNGKTTTCSLLGKIFEEAGKSAFVCGNIGLPISSVALKSDKKSFIVCETSNFQLELSESFSPEIACVLNIQEDHLDRHESFGEYVRVKNKIFQNCKGSCEGVVNLDDEGVMRLNLPKKVNFFSFNPLKKGISVKNGCIYNGKTRIISVDDIPLIGKKNVSNVMAAVAIACLCKIKPKFIQSAIMHFSPPPHRLEYVDEIEGVKFVNDSKSTNIACVKMALESLEGQKIVLMVGGQNKDLDFEKFFEERPKISRCICFGEAGETIHAAATKFGYQSECFETLKEATLYAKREAEAGELVLLSPGCTSFDEFSSYAVRGQIFTELVRSES